MGNGTRTKKMLSITGGGGNEEDENAFPAAAISRIFGKKQWRSTHLAFGIQCQVSSSLTA